MKNFTQRDVANYLVFGCIGISVVLASIPSLPLLTAPSIYSILFGLVLIALALVSEGVAAFCAFKFFGMLEHIVEGKKGAAIRLIMSAVVGVVALIGNGALVKIGLNTANDSFGTLREVQMQRADTMLTESRTAAQTAGRITAGEAGALTSTFTIDNAERATLREQDQRTIQRLETDAERKEREAASLRMSAATITERPEFLMILAILVLKFAEVSLVYLASSMPRNYSETAMLTNDERRKLGMPLRGRPPRLVASN